MGGPNPTAMMQMASGVLPQYADQAKKLIAVDLTKDHKLEDPKEAARIEAVRLRNKEGAYLGQIDSDECALVGTRTQVAESILEKRDFRDGIRTRVARARVRNAYRSAAPSIIK